MMFEAGARKVILADSVKHALSLAKTMPRDTPVCGERGGLPPNGFTHGNSPREFQPGSLKGKELVFCTSNGTRAMQEVAEAPVVLAGSLFNATSVVKKALEVASNMRLDISLVCSGDILGTKFAIDDAFAAGFLALLSQREAPKLIGADVDLEESAVAAVRLYRSYLVEMNAADRQFNPPREVILKAFWESANAHVLKNVGLAEDVEFCAQVDITSSVPRLYLERDRLILR